MSSAHHAKEAMRRFACVSSITSRWPLVALLCLAVVLSACGEEQQGSSCQDDECTSPPAPLCEGDQRVVFSPFGECDEEGGCRYRPTLTACAAGCSEGVCNVSACLPAECGASVPPTCDGDVVVRLSQGTCEDTGCQRRETRTDCAASSLVCRSGQCVSPDPCDVLDCSTPPAPVCERQTAISYGASQGCEDGACQWQSFAENCRDLGLVCDAGRCREPVDCSEVVCDAPPSPVCEGDELRTYGNAGACDPRDGRCSYGSVVEDCAADGGTCLDGACVTGYYCESTACSGPPVPTCVGEVRRYADAAPTCEGDVCTYPLLEQDCAASGQICTDGACVTPDPCLGVACTDRPDDRCDGQTAVRFRAGVCADGLCGYAEVREDCTTTGRTCDAGICRGPCDGVSCGAAPAPRCEGNLAIVSYAPGTCEAGTCSFSTTSLDCTIQGATCDAGVCVAVDPCGGVACNTPPAATCDGNVRVTYADDGFCRPGGCTYATNRQDCRATGEFCDAGSCVAADPCDTAVCDVPPAPVCDGTLVIGYRSTGTCQEGACSYPAAVLTDCAELDATCDAGRCVGAPDLCDDVVCDRPEPGTCDGDVFLGFASPGTCDGAVCDYLPARDNCALPPASFCDGFAAVTLAPGTCTANGCTRAEASRVSCAATGEVCRDGACVEPDPCDGVTCTAAIPAYCDGDVVMGYVSPGTCTGGVCDYPVEVQTDCAATGQACAGGRCVARGPCEGVVCETCPPDICDGDVVLRAACPGTCNAGTCLYSRAPFADCGAAGETCVAGQCVPPDPCVGVSCDTVPPPFCEDNILVSPTNPRCIGGSCAWDEASENCAAVFGGQCVAGACIVVDLCEGVTCPAEPPTCRGSDRVERQTPLCVAGTCTVEVTQEFCEVDSFCYEGACRPLAQCAEIACGDIPDDVCSFGPIDSAIQYDGTASCDGAGFCVFPFTEVDCGALGETCFDGSCVPIVDPSDGDLVINELRFFGVDGEERWLEISNVVGRRFDLGGVRVTVNGAHVDLTDADTIPARGQLLVVASRGAVPTGYSTLVWEDLADVPLATAAGSVTLSVAGFVVDRVDWDTTWGFSVETSLALDPRFESSTDNDDPTAWCAVWEPSPGLNNRTCDGSTD